MELQRCLVFASDFAKFLYTYGYFPNRRLKFLSLKIAPKVTLGCIVSNCCMLADSTRQARDLRDEEAEERWLERELRQQENEQQRKEHPTANNRKKDDWER